MKKTNWKATRQIISDNTEQHHLFLTLIDDEGNIRCANVAMTRELEIGNPRLQPINFFELIHPSNVGRFKSALQQAGGQARSQDVELYIRNGIYHPMRWKVTTVENEDGKSYLCSGYKIADDKRMLRFSELLKNNTHHIIESSNGILFHDTSGELIAANQSAAAIFGTSLERLYQLKNTEDLWNNHWTITDENGKQVLFKDTSFIRAIRTSRPQRQTLNIRLKSGEERCIIFNSQPLFEEKETGGLFPVVSNLVDITYQQHLSRGLKMRDAVISSFLKETPDLAWVIDESGILHFASNAFYRHFELKEKECVNAKVTDLLPPSVVKAVYEHHINVFKSGKPLQATEKVKWADGSHSITHLHIFPIKNISGKKLLGAQAIYVPDKNKLEKELKDAHERLLNFSRATSDAIWEWDMQSGQIFRNEALMEMIGYQLDNSKGLSWWLRRIHPEDRNRLADKVKEATDKLQQSWQDEYRFKCADGTYKHVQDKGFVVYENNLPVKMIGSLHDISSLKKLEKELANLQTQRQQEISETVIKVQEKERTRIGHELHDNVNQLLSTAKLFFDGITPANAEQRQLKQKSTEYLLMAIEEIRKLSKELVTPTLKDENLAGAIATLIQDIQLTGKLKITFRHSIGQEPVSSNKKITLFRIVQEQLKNILQHSRATLAEISLQLKDDQIFLTIKDNGKGFDPSQTRQGIGLSNIRERAQFYNGTTHINASPGRGCTVSVVMPVGK